MESGVSQGETPGTVYVIKQVIYNLLDFYKLTTRTGVPAWGYTSLSHFIPFKHTKLG